MSWLLGSRYQQSQDFSQYAQPPADGAGGAGDSGSNVPPKSIGKAQMDAYRFDSSALERAAAAAKDLEKSPNANAILELTKLQETTKQAEVVAKAREYEMNMEQIKLEQKRVDGDERRKTIGEETKQHQMRAQYQDSLARKRYDEQLAQQQRMNEETLRRQEESVAKQEAIRKATIEHEMDLRHKSEMKKIEAELKAKAKADRENHDLNLEKIRLKAAENRITVLEKVKTVGSAVGGGLNSLLEDQTKLLAAVSGISLVALGFFTAKRTTAVASRYIMAHLQKPTLVRETSRFSPLDIVRHPIQSLQKLKELRKPADALSGVVLAPKLEERLRDIAIATKNTKRNKGIYSNVLMHGPPGTGKTMFAKKLAQHSGMDYAILSGGDFSRMGKHGVAAIDEVFDWASTSRKGLVLFIDEAEAFLRKRSSEDMSIDVRDMLSTFLARTGGESSKLMLVLTSNTPEQFDWAMHDRLDEMVEFRLPGREERERLIRHYFDKFVLQPAAEGKKRLKVAPFDYGALCVKMADITEGMSGRGISKLGRALQVAAYKSADGILTEQMAIDRCLEAAKESKQKLHWQSEKERQDAKSIYAQSEDSRDRKTGGTLSIEPAPTTEKLAPA